MQERASLRDVQPLPGAARYGVAATYAFLALGVIAPTLLAYNAPPSSTFYNQALALTGWGGLCMWLTVSRLTSVPCALLWRGNTPLLALLTALGLIMFVALASPVWAGLSMSLAAGAVGIVASAALVLFVGWRVGVGRPDEVFEALCTVIASAGGLGLLIALVQVFAPGWTDGVWLSVSGIPGRAVGNLRQPNHLSTLLLLACAAVVRLGSATQVGVRSSRASDAWLVLSLPALIWGVVLTGSRTGGLGVVMLAAWGGLDRRLPRTVRLTLIAAPLVYLVWWALMELWAHETTHSFGRTNGGSDISSSRFGIWVNTLSLIRMHPWTGIGFGEFNFAWTLTPFPGRPVAFFDHTHNIVLQLVVELGIPLALLVMGLVCWALRGLVERVRKGRGGHPTTERAALFMVLLAGVHSMLEYPLWYSYFLLPVMFVWGLALAPAPAASTATATAAESSRFGVLALAGIALAAGSLYAVWDYQRVVAIYSPGKNARPLSERIARGQHSTFFSHQGDYAAATTADSPGEAIDAFERAAHNLIDARLLRGWAEAEAELGHLDRARYLAHRLREFHHPLGDELFTVCDGSAESVQKYFQCGPDPTNLTFEDFRRPRR